MHDLMVIPYKNSIEKFVHQKNYINNRLPV